MSVEVFELQALPHDFESQMIKDQPITCLSDQLTMTNKHTNV